MTHSTSGAGSGAEVKAQVMEAHRIAQHHFYADALAALSDCVVLTREEQQVVREAMEHFRRGRLSGAWNDVLDLLTPDPKEQP